MPSDTPDVFEQWCLVEIMGHDRYAGRVSEQTIGGATLIRVDVPATKHNVAFTKMFGTSAIFSITIVTEAVARAAAERFQSRPVEVVGFPNRVQEALPIFDDEEDWHR